MDLFDDLIKEAQKNKKDFLRTVKVMQDIKKQGITAAFNNKFANQGDRAKCRFITTPIRDGLIGERPKYVAQVADITLGDAGDLPIPFILTTYHLQQMYGELIDAKILKDPLKDRKLNCSVGTVWNIEAVESTFKTGKKDFMLRFDVVPEESVINTEQHIQELQEKVDLGMAV